ncbi:hypothetical protein LIA77_06844 [Sarocladium implicatum]|nr:hypothetical protein LIA77_06844 [Sarocladium implicatum]
MERLQKRFSKLGLSSDSASTSSQGQKTGESSSQADSQETADSGYASTELQQDAKDADEPGCLGRPLPGTHLKYYDQEIPLHLRERFFDIKVMYSQLLVDAILKKRRVSGDIGMKLRYLGTTSRSTELCIVFQCDKKTAKVIRKFFRQPHIDEEIRPDFRVVVLEQELVRLADDAEIQVRIREIPTRTWCGVPITMSNQRGETVTVTFGGVIMAKGSNGDLKWYGLTAGHALRRLGETGLPTPEASDSDSDSDSDFGSDVSSRRMEEAAADIIAPKEDQINVHSSKLIGRVLLHNLSSPMQRNLDWALIEPIGVKILPNLVTWMQKPMLHSVPPINLPDEPPQEYSSASVFVVTCRGPLSATLSFSTSSTLISPGQEFAETHELTMDPGMSLEQGDSGSWVVERANGAVHGFVVSVDAFGEAQVMPIEDVVEEIPKVLSADQGLSSNLADNSKSRPNPQMARQSSDLSARLQNVGLTQRHDALLRIAVLEKCCRSLYVQLSPSGHERNSPERQEIATSVRQLLKTLRHLRVEVFDPDSSLYSRIGNSSQSRQLTFVLDRCQYLLGLEQGLAQSSAKGSAWRRGESNSHNAAVMREMTANIVNIKEEIEMLLDTVQLQVADNRTPARAAGQSLGIDSIKDKVDAIATRVYAWKDRSVYEDNEDKGWSAFKTELEKEGFSPEVLQRHQGVLRAYIREVDTIAQETGGAPPTVRDVLKHDAHRPAVPGPVRLAKPFVLSDNDTQSTTGSTLTSKDTRPTSLTASTLSVSQGPPEAGDIDDLITLISTKELLALDQQGPLIPGVNPRVSAFRLAPDTYGNDIPMDAQWTKIHRSMISVEVLEQIGVRYEARPRYVAILGRLTREQTASYARQSASMRFARWEKESRSQKYVGFDLDSSDLDDSGDDKQGVYKGSMRTQGDPYHDRTSAEDQTILPLPGIPSDEDKDKPTGSKTVMPKPILKSKSEKHVRFDTFALEENIPPMPTRTKPQDLGEMLYRRERDRDSKLYRDRMYAPPSKQDRDSRWNGDTKWVRPRDRDSERDRERERDRDRDRSEKTLRHVRNNQKRPVRGETLGIGGAAASLLSVLAEASSAL